MSEELQDNKSKDIKLSKDLALQKKLLSTTQGLSQSDGFCFKEPFIIDFVLALGLLIAAGGFTSSLIKTYISHTAMQNINQHNYKAAINILKGVPIIDFFTVPGTDMEDLYNKALYFDAIEKLDDEKDNNEAIKELQKIKPGSRFYNLSQLALKEYIKK